MRGKSVLVTGANSGIGRATTEALARLGPSVIMLCRDTHRGTEARDQIRRSTGGDVHLLVADLGSSYQVRAACAEFGERFGGLDVLVNNAGATFRDRKLTVDGHEATFGVNYLGTYLLTRLLLDRLCAVAAARIINLVGIYYKKGQLCLDDLEFERRPYSMAEAANQAQLARMMFTVELARRLAGTDVSVNAVHPGAVLTNLQRELPWYWKALIHTVLRPGFTTVRKGALPVIRLATADDVAGITGRFFNRNRQVELAGAARDRSRCEQLWLHSAALYGLDAELAVAGEAESCTQLS